MSDSLPTEMVEIKRRDKEIAKLKNHIIDCEVSIDRRDLIINGLENDLDRTERELAKLKEQLDIFVEGHANHTRQPSDKPEETGGGYG